MALTSATQRRPEAWSQGVHYVRNATEGRRRARKRVIRAKDLKWEENIQGKNAYIIDSITGVDSKNLAMFIREIPPGTATGVHHHNFEAVGYVLDGKGHDVHDGKIVSWKKGDGLYIPPLVEHQHVNDDPIRSARLLFITNWPLLSHLGITTFVQTGEAPRTSFRKRSRDGRRRRI